MTEKEELELRLKDVILSTCNTIGCKDCLLKWPKDEDGNKCQSDYLIMLIANAEAQIRRNSTNPPHCGMEEKRNDIRINK